MTTFTWTISQLDRNLDTNFVTTAHYRVDATDGDISAGTYGTVGWPVEAPTTPYANLTEAQVIGWVQTSLGKDVVEASLQSQINALKNPVQESGMPWSAA